ncbi:MAG: DUF397 domain-containing protein [Pseudonocardiaceae bacterium]
MIHEDLVVRAGWRKSSFSGDGGVGGGNCVEVAPLADGTIALRDSKHPEAATLCFTHTELPGHTLQSRRVRRLDLTPDNCSACSA